MAHGYSSLKKGIQSYLSSDGWVNILSGMVTQVRWRTGWGCESLSVFKVEYNFLFTLLQSLEWGKRGREREKVGHQSSFVHISRNFQVSVSTYIIELLSVIYLAISRSYTRAEVNSNLTSGLCWSLPESVLILGKKWLLGLTRVVKRRGFAAPPPTL